MTVCGKVNQHSNAFSKQPRLREVLQKVRPPVGARVLQRCNSQIFTVHRFPGVALTQTGAMVVLVAITKGAKLTDPHWSRIRPRKLQHTAARGIRGPNMAKLTAPRAPHWFSSTMKPQSLPSWSCRA